MEVDTNSRSLRTILQPIRPQELTLVRKSIKAKSNDITLHHAKYDTGTIEIASFAECLT
jgi:hypothetical protein